MTILKIFLVNICKGNLNQPKNDLIRQNYQLKVCKSHYSLVEVIVRVEHFNTIFYQMFKTRFERTFFMCEHLIIIYFTQKLKESNLLAVIAHASNISLKAHLFSCLTTTRLVTLLKPHTYIASHCAITKINRFIQK